MRRKVNIMVGTSPKGQGGIATVIDGYQRDGFFERTQTILVGSHHSSDKTKIRSYIRFLIAIAYIAIIHVLFDVKVVHIHMASRGSYLRKSNVVKLCKFLGSKIIIHLHGAEFAHFYEKECSESKQAQIRCTFNSADKVVVLSTQWLEWIRTLLADEKRACVVYNGVPSINYKDVQNRTENILFLGRLGERKGVGDLIRAFAKISPRFPESRLLLGGDGEIAKFKALVDNLDISDSVEFLGWVAGEDKLKLLKESKIYSLPSYNEGFPMGVLEAMSAELAVVASKAGGIPDAIENSKEGLLIDAGDVVALAQALESLLENDVLRQNMIRNAKKKYAENFEPSVIIPQIEELYTELASE